MADPVSILGRHAEIMSKIYDRINNVHKRPLHPGQIKVARDYFKRGMRVVQSQWGRNGGKTEDILFIGNTACLLNDKFWTMIVCPQLKQGKKIYWHKKRLQDYAPPEYVKDVNSTDLKVEFKNGSIITVDGCENYEALRGAKPNLVIYDEFQHHSREFHLEVMEPNLVEKNSALLVFGTPPKDRSAFYVEFREQLLKEIADGACDMSYYEFPSEVNPVNDKVELAKKRRRLIESGNEVIWYREYEGKLVFGGQDAVFPKWNPTAHVRRHQVVMSYVESDKYKLRWYTIFDPGTTSCFAILFVAYNPYTQQVFVLDEIYEKDRARTDSKQMWERALKKEKELFPNAPPRTWRRFYDEAAAWFYREVCANNRGQMISLAPTKKQHSTKDDTVSQAKVLMNEPNAFTVSDRCYWFRWEIESYVTDEEGRLPDANDHLLDDFFYFLQLSNWAPIERAEDTLAPIEASPGVDPQAPRRVEASEWADNVVEGSLGVSSHDILSEWYY